MADDLAATLAAIRADAQSLAQTNSPSWGTVPKIRRVIAGTERLLATVEAALANHEEFRGFCSGCNDAYGDPAAWPCEEYRAITAALTGADVPRT